MVFGGEDQDDFDFFAHSEAPGPFFQIPKNNVLTLAALNVKLPYFKILRFKGSKPKLFVAFSGPTSSVMRYCHSNPYAVWV